MHNLGGQSAILQKLEQVAKSSEHCMKPKNGRKRFWRINFESEDSLFYLIKSA
jgi:hypothetical protein